MNRVPTPQVPRSFYHVSSRNNRVLIESYCLVCQKFVAASRSEPNLHLMEIAHRSTCKKKAGDLRLSSGNTLEKRPASGISAIRSASYTPRVLIIENSPSDVVKGIRILKSFNISDPIIMTSVDRAMLYLEEVVAGEKGCPNLMILDLDFGLESGFEILRFRKTHPILQSCEVLVWTIMGDKEKEFCRLFGVACVISKQDGEVALEDGLRSCIEGRPEIH
jgi:hypothetical protein